MFSQRRFDPASGRYYDVIGPDQNGQYITVWVNDLQGAATGSLDNERQDSAIETTEASVMIPPAPEAVRNTLSFTGTPERGWYDRLDHRYRVRTRAEAHNFFRKGRVFAMLWAETASETLTRNGTENTAITVGRFNENVFSQIRRFVVVEVNRERHFVYACAISTYGNQGVMKRGCKASEHTIVYLKNSQPTRLAGEWERGMTKDPIMIEPTEANEEMLVASRLRCGKIHSIEWNVKVRDIGMVCSRDRTKLIKYYQEERGNGFDPDSDVNDEQMPQPQHALQPDHGFSYPQNAYGYVQPSHNPQYNQYSRVNYAQYPPQQHQHQ